MLCRREIKCSAIALLFIAMIGNPSRAFAAGPYDGEWAGATPQDSKDYRCGSIDVRTVVIDGQLSAELLTMTGSILLKGSIGPDGMFSGAWIVLRTNQQEEVTGKFSGTQFRSDPYANLCGNQEALELHRVQ